MVCLDTEPFLLRTPLRPPSPHASYGVGRRPCIFSSVPVDETDTCVKALQTICEALRFTGRVYSTPALTTNTLSGGELGPAPRALLCVRGSRHDGISMLHTNAYTLETRAKLQLPVRCPACPSAQKAVF